MQGDRRIHQDTCTLSKRCVHTPRYDTHKRQRDMHTYPPIGVTYLGRDTQICIPRERKTQMHTKRHTHRGTYARRESSEQR